MPVEYKRFRNWDDIFMEEKKAMEELYAEKKMRPMTKMDEVGLAIERALNRLGKEGWKLCLEKQPGAGIFFMRDVKQEVIIKSIDEIFGLPKTEEKKNETSGEVPAQKP